MPHASSSAPLLALVGGFLGAGKTTLIARAVARLQALGLRCAVVSNDQSVGLIDSTAARTLAGAAVGEVTGACFCCKLDELAGVVERLRTEERPDVILCEPVGSCTDLMSTVIRPLEQIYRMEVRIAPFTVVLDARRALTAFGGGRRKKDFAKDVGYIFRKQVEEAEILFINKAETMDEAERGNVRAALEKEFPGKQIRFGSAKGDERVAEWLEDGLGAGGGGEDASSLAATLTERRYKQFMEVDYGVYARGEAMLGWYNAEVAFRSAEPLDGNAWLLARAEEIAKRLEEECCEVAHFKMSLEKIQDGKTQNLRKEGAESLGIVNQVMSGEVPTLSRSMAGLLTCGTLLVNLRAEGDAAALKAIVREVMGGDETAASLTWSHEAAFQPGKPKPTHRIAAALA